MARKSVDFTLSLERFQNHRKEPEKEKSPIEATTSLLSTSSSSLQNQNRQLARTNAAMAVRIQQLELNMSELVSENARLKAIAANAVETNSSHNINTGSLEKHIKGIESTLLTQFDQVFQTIKQLRKDYKLSDNSMLDVLAPYSHPVTSTPLSQELALNVLFPSFGDPTPIPIVAPAPLRVSKDPMEYFEKEDTPVSAADISFAENDEPSIPNYACSPILEDSHETSNSTPLVQLDTLNDGPLLPPSTEESGGAHRSFNLEREPSKEESTSSSLRRSKRSKKQVEYKLRNEPTPLLSSGESSKRLMVPYSDEKEEPQKTSNDDKNPEPKKRAALANVTNANNKRRRRIRDDEVFDIPKGSLTLSNRKNKNKIIGSVLEV